MSEGIIDIKSVIAAYNSDPRACIEEAENNYESQLKHISERIINSDPRRDVLLISGPSSSGKS
ncbi:MAG: hypothetical protein IKZ81_06565, partial [Clostridia bacterium]|nr:hypothetical protein [Clostridia bacterium]